ncbi:hypothetical protein [Cronobacter sakazakii]|uniref:hypothetical protein n=1 Tax=Cronobacter sakazakii TaxID=28141 RepID=UPI001ED951E0|nr:hypothetical protein [Cronobacter sakazakii]MDT3594948.1 hypothetical protein [Cronobacter sakazakii]USI30324.1 hypothetical protein NES82_00615 [Cronobacter sakazakii]
MFYRLLLARVLKFHAFRHADYEIKCLILNGIYELFHGEIAMLMTPFLPENFSGRRRQKSQRYRKRRSFKGEQKALLTKS